MSTAFVGPLGNPRRDYMQDPHVVTVGDALAAVDFEAVEGYRRAGEPGDLLSVSEKLAWALGESESGNG